MPGTVPLILLELNEVNFEYVKFYVAKGRLPGFSALIEQHGVSETVSEHSREHLEPWIQWVTAHTGKTYAEHRVYRLGDIVDHDIPQIWEILEECNVKVGAISPMNAKYRLRDPAFFVPDPWTPTDVRARPVLAHLYEALSQAVNDNAHGRITASSVLRFAHGALRYARVPNYLEYIALLAQSVPRRWARALFLDLLLADIFVKEVCRTEPGFASLFLNAAAHIQHHYMFCSSAYAGGHRNPDWYVDAKADPVLDAYALYDRVVRDLRNAFPRSRLMVATGLHQDPHSKVTYYWRLKQHDTFLGTIGARYERVEPRMSRDFVVVCRNSTEAREAESLLRGVTAEDGTPLFDVDNRGSDLFVMLTYADEIRRDDAFMVGQQRFADLYQHVAFVALKNGEHNGVGYFIDTGVSAGEARERFSLTEMPALILAALGVSDSDPRRSYA